MKTEYTIQVLNHIYHFNDYELYTDYKDALIYCIRGWFYRYDCDYIKESCRIKYAPLFYDLDNTIKKIPELFDDITDVIDCYVDIYVNQSELSNPQFIELFNADVEHVLYICKEKRLINVEKQEKIANLFTVS